MICNFFSHSNKWLYHVLNSGIRYKKIKMKKHRRFALNLILMLVVVFAKNTFAEPIKKPLYIDLIRVLGFIAGQNLDLDRIKDAYPALSLQVKKTKLEFNSAFGVSERNIKKELKNILKDRYPKYIAAMKRQLNIMLKPQHITRNAADKFIKEVNLRVAGKLPSPILETLLSYQFKERPVSEFTYGFKNVYLTKDNIKSKGLDLKIEYVKSWSKREGNRPNVIQFFRSDNGRGPAYALIMVRDIVEEAQAQSELSPQEIKAFMTFEGSKALALKAFSKNSLIEMANEMGLTNIRDINTKRIVIDNWPGALLEFTGDKQRLDTTITIYNRTYVAIYKNYMIYLQCFVAKSPNDTKDDLKDKILQFNPLFRLMANSLIIQNQY